MTVSNYATENEFRAYIKDTSSLDPDSITMALESASRQVEAYCGRQFYQTVETQYFSPNPGNLYLLELGDVDLATTTGLTVNVDFGIAGTYPEPRVFGTDFICQPINQSVNGVAGWPFTSLQSVNGKIWPQRYVDYYRDTVKITGTFGWPAIPDPVRQATLLLAAENYKLADAPFGAVVGFGAFGTGSMRVRENSPALARLRPYRKQTSLLFA